MDTRKLSMTDNAELTFQVNNEQRTLKPTKLCLEQIGGRVGIPAKYLERMRAEAPQLLAQNVNHWFSNTPEVRMLRTIQNGEMTARAFLSQKYRPLDNFDLLNSVLPRIVEAGCEIKSCEVTEKRLYIQAVTAKIAGEIKKGDAVQAGIVISNSEVGCGSIRIEPMIYRLVCTNGMILPTAMRKHHIGKAGDGEWDEGDAYEVFSDATRKLDDKAFWAKVNDVVTASLDSIKFAAALDRLRATTAIDTGKPLEAVEIVANKFDMRENEKENVLTHLASGGDLSLWGLSNSVTRAAEDCESYDRAIEMERIGGMVVELPASVFNN